MDATARRRNRRDDATSATDAIDAMNAKDDAMDAMTQQTQIPEDEVNLLDYWRGIWKGRGVKGGGFFFSGVCSLVGIPRMSQIYQRLSTFIPSISSPQCGAGWLLFASTAAG